MAIEIKEFETMVNDTLRRITNSTNISNTNPGSVIRTIVEALLAENDIQYYQINQIFNNMYIDTATNNDLDRLVKIFGVIRKSATKCITYITFGRTSPSDNDIIIPIGNIISTYSNNNNDIIEFEVTEENAYLPAGDLEVEVECTAKVAGNIYVPINTVKIMNSPIINIEYINNDNNIYGGTDIESDNELRTRSKEVLSLLGRGTANSLESAIKSINGVQDAVCIDVARGVGTADIIVVTSDVIPTQELQDVIEETVLLNKAAGIDVNITYPTIITTDITITTTHFVDIDTIGNGILNYITSLSIGDSFIINQMERYILNECNDIDMDIVTISPISNINPSASQIVRNNIITINGVVWNNE